jgi:hypothetical protein
MAPRKSLKTNKNKSSLINRIPYWVPREAETAWDVKGNRYFTIDRLQEKSKNYTFTRAGFALKSDGTLAANNVQRLDSNGLLYEPAGDNLIETPYFDGATAGVIGSGGAFPGQWNFSQTTLVREVVTKTHNKIRMRANRTGGTPSTTSLTFRSSASASYPVVTGAVSTSAKLTLISFTGAFLNISFGVQEQTSGGGAVGTTTNTPLTVAGTVTEEIKWRNIPNGNKAAFVVVTNLSDATADFEVVFELEFPQMEYSATAEATTWMNSIDGTDPRAVDAISQSMMRNGEKWVGSFYETGGYWDNPTVSNNLYTIVARGGKANKLLSTVTLPAPTTFLQRAVVAEQLSPFVFTNQVAATRTINGQSFTVHSSGADHTLKYATNRNDLFQFDTRDTDFWTSEASQDRNRSEFSGSTKFASDTNIYYSDHFRLLSCDYDKITQHLIVGQLHATEDGGDVSTSPIFFFNITRDGMEIKTATAASGPTAPVASTLRYLWTGFRMNEWVARVVRLKVNNAGAAELQVWLNGVQVLNLTGISIGYPDTVGPYWKFGNYIRANMPSNSIRVLTQYARVECGTTDLTSRVTTPLEIV